ncbi:hypothetical protein [Thermincola ferriacetica]
MGILKNGQTPAGPALCHRMLCGCSFTQTMLLQLGGRLSTGEAGGLAVVFAWSSAGTWLSDVELATACLH